MTVRYSAILAFFSILLFLAVPWVEVTETWTLYYMALTSLVGAVVSFLMLND